MKKLIEWGHEEQRVLLRILDMLPPHERRGASGVLLDNILVAPHLGGVLHRWVERFAAGLDESNPSTPEAKAAFWEACEELYAAVITRGKAT